MLISELNLDGVLLLVIPIQMVGMCVHVCMCVLVCEPQSKCSEQFLAHVQIGLVAVYLVVHVCEHLCVCGVWAGNHLRPKIMLPSGDGALPVVGGWQDRLRTRLAIVYTQPV